jgi:hypothetical protein
MILFKLLKKKWQLVKRLEEADLGPDERAEHEMVLAKIDTALNLLDPVITRQKQQSEGKTTARARGMVELKSRTRAPGTVHDPRRALALVRWRQKVRRNG